MTYRKHVTATLTTSRGANRAQIRASFHNPNATRNHHSKNRPRVGDAPHGKGTRAFDPAKWVEKKWFEALQRVAIGLAA